MLTATKSRIVLAKGWLLLALILFLSTGCLLRQPAETEMPIPTVAIPGTAVVTETSATASATATAATSTPGTGETDTGAQATATSTPMIVDTNTPQPEAAAATPIGVVGSDVPYIMGLVDLNLRQGPDIAYAIVGWMSQGQIARVTGMSSDGNWWQLECPSQAANRCWVAAGDDYTQPEPAATRVQFAPGATSETLTGTMDEQTQVRYVLRAAAGQTMVVRASSTPADSVLFHLQGLHDGQIYKHLLDGESSWQGTLTETQDYLLALNAVGGSTNYSIYVSITNGAPPAVTPTATATPTGEPMPGGPLYPVVDAETGYLLGGTRNGAWIDGPTYAAYLQDTARPYNLYTLSGYQGNVSGAPPVSSGICAQPVVDLQPRENLAEAVALVAAWDATPRIAQALPADSDPYPEVIASLLEAEGLANPEVQIDSILRFDLEGDGVDEVLISASRFSAGGGSPAVAAGDYSLVILRKTTGDVTVNAPLALDVYLEADPLAYPFRHSVLGLMDLSGDGWLEIIVEADRYEGRTVAVYEATYAGLQLVLDAGCVE